MSQTAANTPETSTTETYKALFEEFMRDACLELFAGSGVELDYRGDRAAGQDEHAFSYAGVLGFGGEAVKGSVSLFLDEALLRASHPLRVKLPEGDASIEPLRDWISELANQLTGRIKNKLVRYGAEVNLGIPTAVSGFQFRLTHPGGETQWHYMFGWQSSLLTTALTVRLKPGTVLELSEDDNATAAEGELILF